MYKRVHTYNRGIWNGLSTPTIAALAGVSKSKTYRHLKSLAKSGQVTMSDIGEFIKDCRIQETNEIGGLVSTMEEILR